MRRRRGSLSSSKVAVRERARVECSAEKLTSRSEPMTMLQLAGPPAATAFRIEKLRVELRSLASTVTDVATHFEHFVHVERPLTEREDRVLRALLDYGGGV